MHYLLYTHTHAHTHTSLHVYLSEFMEIDTLCQPSLPKSTEGISIDNYTVPFMHKTMHTAMW